MSGGRIASVTVAGAEIGADYYIAALPVEIMTFLCSEELEIGGLRSLLPIWDVSKLLG